MKVTHHHRANAVLAYVAGLLAYLLGHDLLANVDVAIAGGFLLSALLIEHVEHDNPSDTSGEPSGLPRARIR